MKTALLFSGQPREVERCCLPIIQHIISDRSPDIFAHIWNYGGRDPQNVKNIYRPTDIVFEDKRSGCDLWPDWNIRHYGNNVYNKLSMFYSILHSWQLMEKYEEKNNFRYDYVIKCRTDLNMINRIDEIDLISDLDENEIFVLERTVDTGSQPHDILLFGKRPAMEQYCTVYNRLKQILDNPKMDKNFGGLTLLHFLLNHTDLKYKYYPSWTDGLKRIAIWRPAK